MSTFTYEVVGDYAEKDGLKVRSIAYNGREPKFDIRHWTEKNGEEVMGKGVTLSIEEMLWLSTELPKVIQGIVGNAAPDTEDAENDTEDDSDDDSEDDTSKTTELLRYVVQSAEEKEPDNTKLHGIIIAKGKSYATNNELIVKVNEKVNDIDKVADNPKLRETVGMFELMEKKGLNIGEINKFKSAYKTIQGKAGTYYYSFGKGKPTINARYLGKSLEALDGKIKYTDAGMLTVSSDKGTSLILPMSNEIEEVGLIEV